MSVENIPARTVIRCDVCRDPMTTGLMVEGTRSGTGFSGDVGGGDVRVDLCERCDVAFQRWLAVRGRSVLDEAAERPASPDGAHR